MESKARGFDIKTAIGRTGVVVILEERRRSGGKVFHQADDLHGVPAVRAGQRVGLSLAN